MDPTYRQVIEEYFDALAQAFGPLAAEAERHQVDPALIAEDFLANSASLDAVRTELAPNFFRFLEAFWHKHREVAYLQCTSCGGLTARFGGDIGPQLSADIFQRAGVYFDTIVVPDPLLRVARMPDITKRREYYLLKHGISLLLSRDVYLADVHPPIALLIPHAYHKPGSASYVALMSGAEFDFVLFVNAAWGLHTENFEDAVSSLKGLGTIEEVLDQLIRPDLFLFDESAGRGAMDQFFANIEQFHNEIAIDTTKASTVGKFARTDSIDALVLSIMSRLMQVNDVVLSAHQLRSEVLVSAPIPFHWLNTKYQLNAQALLGDRAEQVTKLMHLTNALLSRNLDWLANVPLEALVKLRREGSTRLVRNMFAEALSNLQGLDADSFDRTAKAIDYDLTEQLKAHQAALACLNDELRGQLSIDLPSLLLSVSGAIAPGLGIMVPGWVQTTLTFVGCASLTQLITQVRSYLERKKILLSGPTGILWRARQNT